jgi:hypothetical protein
MGAAIFKRAVYRLGQAGDDRHNDAGDHSDAPEDTKMEENEAGHGDGSRHDCRLETPWSSEAMVVPTT